MEGSAAPVSLDYHALTLAETSYLEAVFGLDPLSKNMESERRLAMHTLEEYTRPVLGAKKIK